MPHDNDPKKNELDSHVSHNDGHKHSELRSSNILYDAIVAIALTRSIYRDIKENFEEYTPHPVQDKTRPIINKMHSYSKGLFERHLPRLYHFSHSKNAGYAGFLLSVTALLVHYEHLEHQYSHTGEKIKNHAKKAEDGLMSRYGHFTEENIRKRVYNSTANRPY